MVISEEIRFATEEEAASARPVWTISPDTLGAWVEAAPDRRASWLLANGFEATPGRTLVVPDERGGIEGAVFGLGAGPLSGLEARLFGALPYALPEGGYRVEGLPQDVASRESAALGWLLGSYRFTAYRRSSRAPARLVPPEGIDADRLLTLARGVDLARNLINTPTADMGPEQLEAEFRRLAEAHGAEAASIVGESLLDRNYPLIHAVGRAGPQPPRLLDMRWQGPEPRLRVTLVGKGVCFDTGGLDLKPSAAMLLMKKDMGGAAAAMALASMIMERHLPVSLRVLVPAVENSVSSKSFRPGDVLTSRNGMTVENRNTDAEGRLVLADALEEACSDSPDLLFDFATLTGAARVALGADVPPFFTQGDALAQEIAAAGEAVGDPVWRLPLYAGYERDLSSAIADITNAPANGMGGAITAALFLQRFVENPVRWAHFDIYGWCQKARPGRPEGGECHAALAVFRVIEARATGAAHG